MQNNKTIKKEKGSFDGIRRNSKTKTFDSHQSKSGMLYSGLKMTVVVSLALVLFTGLSNMGSTMSYFSDIEQSIGNYLRADPLYFTVTMASSTQIDLSSGEEVIVPVMTSGLDSELAQYFVRAEMTGGDSGLCNAIHVLGTFPFPYDGPILGISTATTTDVGSWTLTTSLAYSSFATSTSCSIDLVYKGWNADAPLGSGYTDSEKISLTFFVSAESASTTDGTTVNTTDSTTDAVLPSVAVPEDLGETIVASSTMTVVDPAPVPEEVETSLSPIPEPVPESASELVSELVPESAPVPDSVPQADLTPTSPPT